MGIYRPLIERAQGANKPKTDRPLSTKLLTVPTTITGTRVPLALAAGAKILRGEKYATPYVAAMAISDMEGLPARLIDQYFPNSGRGSSEIGTKADVAADVLAGIVLATAIIFGPNTTKTAKAATALTLGRSGLKSVWYIETNRNFKRALANAELPTQNFELPVDMDGKETTVEDFITLCCAAATNDVENPYGRAILSGAAIAHTIPSSSRGLRLLGKYDTTAKERISQINAGDFSSLKLPEVAAT